MTSVDDINSLESEAGIIASLIHKPDFIFYSEYLLPKYMSTQNVEEMIDKGSADKALTNFLDEFTITTQS